MLLRIFKVDYTATVHGSKLIMSAWRYGSAGGWQIAPLGVTVTAAVSEACSDRRCKFGRLPYVR